MKINKLHANPSNYGGLRKQKVQYIVMHYTANNGDTALSNCKYFTKPNLNTSAHYFVDEKEIYESVKPSAVAWHCGTSGKYKHKHCRNENAIGVELCSRKDSKNKYYFKDETVYNAVSLVKNLMKEYNIPISNVIRHYDVTGKQCPRPFIENTVLWNNFINKLK